MTIRELLESNKLYAVGAREYLETQEPGLDVEQWLPDCRHASTLMDLTLLLRPELTGPAIVMMLEAAEGTQAYPLVASALLPTAGRAEARVALVEAVEHLVIDSIRSLSLSEDLVEADDRQISLCRLIQALG